MLKKYVICVMCICLSFLVGCAHVSYTCKDGKLRYDRLGLQSLTDLELEKGADGSLKVKFSKQEGGEKLLDAVKNISQAALNVTKSVSTTP